jgi:polyisoprenoid-binding protein YceI
MGAWREYLEVIMTTTVATEVRTLTVDKAHSEVTFQVRHLLSRVQGHFQDFSGTITFDEQNPVGSFARLTIDPSSISTHEARRDDHLRSADFFDVVKYPALTFQSTKITAAGSQRYNVEGDLTIHGVTRRIVVPTTYLGNAKDPWGNQKHAFEGEVTINRKDFGLNWNAALETGGFLVGDEVKISFSIQAA